LEKRRVSREADELTYESTEEEHTLANDKSLREHLIYSLEDGGAHLKFDTAIQNLPAEARFKRPAGAAHSPWEVIEHMRIAQRDILDFSHDGTHVSPEFPAGYWPDPKVKPGEREWQKSVDQFRADFAQVLKLARNESKDLFAKIPGGDGQTILRELLLIADHNAYHLGELVALRRSLGAWHQS